MTRRLGTLLLRRSLSILGWALLTLAAVTNDGCASLSNARIEYEERGGLSAREYWEACDEGLDSLQVEAKYFTNAR